MKKYTAIFLAIVMVLSLAACGSGSNGSAPAESQPPASAQEPASTPATAGSESSAVTPPASNEPQGAGNAEPSSGSGGNTEAPSSESDNTEASSSGSGSTEAPSSGSGGNTETPSSGGGTEQGSNILVAYFSRSGNTVWADGVDAVTSASINLIDGTITGNAELLARMAQETTGGDLFLIQTVDAYPSDYRETTNVAADEQSENARPALASHVANMDQYDTVVRIYPNWWGTLPQALYTFLEEYDFSGKTILPLCTHEGSRMGSSERAIASLCPNATLLEGLAVRGASAASAHSDVETWLNRSGILG